MKHRIGRFAALLALVILALPGFADAEQKPSLRAGSEIDFPPYADINEQGQSTGFAVELFAAVAAVMDIPITFHPGEWDIVWQKLKMGEIDALPLVARMREREGLVEFTEPHTIGYDSFFVRKDSPAIKSIEQARALSIIVLRSDASHDALASRGFTHQLVIVDDLADGLRLLASGEHNAVLAPLLQGNMQVHNIGLKGIVEPGPLLKEYRREFCFAVRKGDIELRNRLNQGLAIVKASGEYDRLYRKWLGIYEATTFPVKYVAWGAGSITFLMALMGLWTWQLRRQVKLRTDELAQAYGAMQAERQRLHDVLQALRVYVVLLSQDYRVTFANRFFEQRYGNAQRRRRYEYLFNRSGPCEVCETFKVLKSGARVDWKWTGPDGHDYEIHDFPFTDTDGSPMIMEVGIDVTEMNRAKQALHEANASLEQRVAKRTAELEVARQEAEQTRDLLQVTMDNAPALMSYVDAECRYRRVNKSYEQWFGHSHEQIYGHHMRDALGETVWQMITPYVERVLGGEQVAFEFSAPYLEGEPRWVYATYSPDIDAAGRVRGFVVHVLDTSERKRVEGALRESEQAFRSLAEAVPQIVWATRPDGWNIYFNQKWVDYTGLTLEESYGHGWNTPFHPDDKQRAWKAWQQATQFHESYSLECRLRRADGVYRWWLIRGMPMRDANGEIQKWFGTCTDIEDLKQAEEALREADLRKDEFLAMLAHELRNPLAPISNAVHIMKRSNLDKAQLAWCRDVIDRQVEQLVRLVDDLLDVSRISRGKIELKKEPLTLSAIVQRAVETSQPLMNARRHELSVCLPPEPVYVEGDLIRLSQVVSNLLTNAAKYTDTGGCIRLTVEQAVDDIFIRVRDNGRGITPAALPSLFQLFYQVDSNIDRSEGGLGIGLSLVKNLVAMHGGSVEAFSEGRGQGSEFVIRLPCLPESVAVPVFCQTGPKLPAEGRLRILVVDDNRDAAQSLSLLLTSEGHAVFLAYDGYTALEVALAERPQVLLLDIGLPGMDGYAVARTLQQHPDLKMAHFIAVSGYGRQVDREQARAAGFNSYLTKPVNFDELQCALAQPLFSGEIPV